MHAERMDVGLVSDSITLASGRRYQSSLTDESLRNQIMLVPASRAVLFRWSIWGACSGEYFIKELWLWIVIMKCVDRSLLVLPRYVPNQQIPQKTPSNFIPDEFFTQILAILDDNWIIIERKGGYYVLVKHDSRIPVLSIPVRKISRTFPYRPFPNEKFPVLSRTVHSRTKNFLYFPVPSIPERKISRTFPYRPFPNEKFPGRSRTVHSRTKFLVATLVIALATGWRWPRCQGNYQFMHFAITIHNHNSLWNTPSPQTDRCQLGDAFPNNSKGTLLYV